MMKQFQLNLLLFITCAIFSSPVFAQLSKPTDQLILQLQKLTDTTILYESTSNWGGAANLYIISKKSDTLNTFTYRNLALNLPHIGIIPSVRTEMVKADRYKMLTVEPAINQYFSYHPLPYDETSRLWKQLTALKPWLLGDDFSKGEGCPGSSTNIYDAGGIRIYLITKDKIKVLDYYAPHYYETVCPGRADRIAAIQIKSLFKKYIL